MPASYRPNTSLIISQEKNACQSSCHSGHIVGFFFRVMSSQSQKAPPEISQREPSRKTFVQQNWGWFRNWKYTDMFWSRRSSFWRTEGRDARLLYVYYVPEHTVFRPVDISWFCFYVFLFFGNTNDVSRKWSRSVWEWPGNIPDPSGPIFIPFW